jgi:hypothetical protein
MHFRTTLEHEMDSTEKPLRLFFNPFSIWTDLAIKTGHAMWASAYAAAASSHAAAKVAVIPTPDAPAPKAQEAARAAERMLASAQTEAPRKPEVAVLPVDTTPRKPRAPVRRPSKAARFKATRAKLRSKANGKRGTHARASSR